MTQVKLLKDIKTVAEFDRGYWYATELKAFARQIGVLNTSRLRKDELEAQIKIWLETGSLPDCTKPSAHNTPLADPLALDQAICHYVSNKQTKSFILAEAQKMCPDLPKKSGVWYWTNRWREEQLDNRRAITYRDLIQHFVELGNQPGRLPQIPSARFNNFVSDFLADDAGTRDDAKAAWETLKSLETPKTYAARKAAKRS